MQFKLFENLSELLLYVWFNRRWFTLLSILFLILIHSQYINIKNKINRQKNTFAHLWNESTCKWHAYISVLRVQMEKQSDFYCIFKQKNLAKEVNFPLSRGKISLIGRWFWRKTAMAEIFFHYLEVSPKQRFHYWEVLLYYKMMVFNAVCAMCHAMKRSHNNFFSLSLSLDYLR